jgi:hypothetical protein
MAALYGSMRAAHMFMVPSKSQRERKVRLAGSTVLTTALLLFSHEKTWLQLIPSGWAHGLQPNGFSFVDPTK